MVADAEGRYGLGMMMLPPVDEMYEALLARDRTYDGLFVVAVKTTSIFCRPTCPARKPKQANVEFFSTARDALHAGYRACKRCQPMDDAGAPPRWVQSLFDAIEQDPQSRRTDADLRTMDIDPARARRFFKQRYGMTFQAYQRARRMGQALSELRTGAPVTQTSLRNGYESESGFREAFTRLFGDTPMQSSALHCMQARWIDTPLGAMLAIANSNGVCLLEFVDRRMIERQIAILRRRFKCTIVPGPNAHLESIKAEMDSYFAGSLQLFQTPLVLDGTPFQQNVWERLLQIPHGETLSYSQLADDIGRAGAQRAVGRANGDNRLGIVVPCHRVVRSDGTLCGYGGGMWRKKWLLEHETSHAAAVS